MIRVRALIAGCLGALASVAGAQAADPPGSWPPKLEASYERPEPQFHELLSGWYLRGDVGYRFNRMDTFQSPVPVTSQNYRDALNATFGFGYKYEWFRADLTVDRSARVNYSGTTATPAVPQPQYLADITALSLLANAYIDFGTWYGFTPYVGAGAGVTQLTSTGFQDTARGASGLEHGTSNNFSWAWMAGVAYRVHPNWMIDVGFRHLDMGDVRATATAYGTSPPMFKNITAQEVRIGVRFLFD